MASIIERARQMLEFPGVVKKSAAHAMGVSPSAVSNILKGKRDISAEEFAKLERHYRLILNGVEESAPAEFTPYPNLSPIYPSRALADQHWVIDLAADPIHRLLAPPTIQGLAEVYGFFAPDGAAWPRYKAGEVVWVSPADRPFAGDDVFIAIGGRAGALHGHVGELAASKSGLTFREYQTGRTREIEKFDGEILKLAPRDR
jgi:transcriptional regulator with XRE-family HTH domain